MKTIDRKDLKTNELAEQLDHITEYAKSNATRIAIWVGGAIVLAVAIFGFMNYRSSRVAEAWAKLGASEATDPGDQIREAREVAEADLNPSLTIQAWLRVGVTAFLQTTPSAPETATKMDWQATAEEAFKKALNLAAKDTTARGQALMSLGVLAENAGKGSDARGYYKQILDDRRFDDTPYKTQAEFRMKGLDEWLEPVVIAPAPPPPPPPAPAAPPVTNMPESIPVNPVDGTPPPTPAPSSGAPSTPPAATPEGAPATEAAPAAGVDAPVDAADTTPPEPEKTEPAATP